MLGASCRQKSTSASRETYMMYDGAMISVGKTERSTLTTCNPARHARDPVIGWRQGGGPLRTIETAGFEIAIGPRSGLAMAQLGCEGALASPWTPVVHCSGQHDPCRCRALALASEPDADRLARATARREQLTGASRPGRPCVPKHNVAANELKRISAMHEYCICVCTRRLYCLVCRVSCVESTTDHHVPCTGKRLDLVVLPAVC